MSKTLIAIIRQILLLLFKNRKIKAAVGKAVPIVQQVKDWCEQPWLVNIVRDTPTIIDDWAIQLPAALLEAITESYLASDVTRLMIIKSRASQADRDDFYLSVASMAIQHELGCTKDHSRFIAQSTYSATKLNVA